MNEELRKSRFREYGSFLYCPRKDCLCFGRDTDQECKHAKCLLEDPEYLALQERIEENRRKNQMADIQPLSSGLPTFSKLAVISVKDPYTVFPLWVNTSTLKCSASFFRPMPSALYVALLLHFGQIPVSLFFIGNRSARKRCPHRVHTASFFFLLYMI